MSMMISKKMATRLNKQVANEFYSAWVYKAMEYTLEEMGFKVFASWFKLQAEEEQEHAEKIAEYMLDQDAPVTLDKLDKPKSSYKSVKEIVKAALDHELEVTKQIHEIAEMASKEKDHATSSFIKWFVDEQVEEVASVKELLDLVEPAQNKGQLLVIEGRVWRMVEARK